MVIPTDDLGQMSIDFLVGVTIFILAFIFLYAAIPSMFAPFQSDSDVLTMAADKVTATLVEEELVNVTGGEPLPGIIDYDKFNGLNGRLNDPDELRSLGLGTSTGGVYNLQVVLQEYDDTTDTFTNITIPADVQPGNQNIGQSRRFVYVRYANTNAVPASYPGIRSILVVRVW
jgi:hypothetical protein